MIVLWLTNTPCGAEELLTGKPSTCGGWLGSLASCVAKEPGIDLHIAFYHGKAVQPFSFEGITYHPILRDGDSSKAGRYMNRLSSQFSDRDDRREVSGLLEMINAVNPDIVHIHGSEENFGLVAEHGLTVKIVLSVQGMLSSCLCKQYSGFARRDVLRKESLVHKILLDGENAGRRSFERKARREARIYRNIRYVLGRTEWDKDCTLAFNPDRKYFVVNEVLRPDFYSSCWHTPLKGGKYSIVTTISNGLYKGLESIYSSAKLLLAAGIDFSWKVIGLSCDDSSVRLTESILKEKHSALGIEFCGRMDAREMTGVLLDSNLYVQTSHIENSSNSLCEAMLLGMPIIASFAGGTSSMLDDGKEGVLVQDGDPYRLAGAIISSVQNPELFSEMGCNARKRAAERHDPKKIVNELITAYEAILND